MTTQPDLTLVLDPAELWPAPEGCPDWPLAFDDINRAMNGVGGRDEAAARLHDLARLLNDDKPTRAPTDTERARLRGEYFAPGNVIDWRWSQLGLDHMRPASSAVTSRARLIVEAAHLRGHLRKLDARAAAAAERKEAARLASLRAAVDRAPETLADLERQLAEAEMGEARHLQRLADEQAAHRAHELRAQIVGVKAEAEQAARLLAREAA
jgi:hypothetical protein